ncbi:MAG: nucleotide exchange factor GrpE, partial [Desulfuromonadales bacterium]|nr:nucleotide exchange factor GrpE [Desulfuromonadales bacterium]
EQQAEEVTEQNEVTEQDAATEPAPEEEVVLGDILTGEMDKLKEEASKNWEMYLRERAELENFRKRTQRDKEDAIRYANDRLLREMVPVLDNLERAVEHADQNGAENEGLLEGVNMTMTQFRKALEDFGVKPIAALGEAFDPNLHQAMGQVESAEQAPNTVATEFQKGYMLHDRLLRPSLVIVTKAPTEEAAESEDDAASDAEQKDE